MSTRPVPFRALVVHKPEPGAPRVAPPPRGRLSFSEMLRRGSAAPESRPMRSGVVAAPEEELFEGLPEARRVPPVEDEPPEEHDGLDQDMVPTPEALETLLAQAPQSVQGVRDRPAQASDAIVALAATIAGFCNERTVQDSEGWSVHIDLRPDVVPETSLDMTVSPHWLQLRFKTGQTASRRLLCEREGELRGQLDKSLDRSREIAITIE